MLIKLHNKEEQTSIRRSSMNDIVFPNCFSTLCKYAGHLPNSLSAIDMWVAAGDFADILLKLIRPEVEVAYEAEDLVIDCANDTEAFLIMIISANRLAALRGVREDIDQLIGLLSKFYIHHALYSEVCLSISRMEMENGSLVNHNSQVRSCQNVDNGEMRKMMQEWADHIVHSPTESMMHNILIFSRMNMDHGHQFDDILQLLFKELDARPLNEFKVTAAQGGVVNAFDIHGNNLVDLNSER